MDYCSEVVRRVEIPQSLPPVENLTKICGNIILKDATASNNRLTVEGDLLWQGFFINDRGEEECLWEGAEFFQEELPFSNLRIRESFMMEPEVTDIVATDAGENNCEMRFSVHWWSEPGEMSEDEENFEDEIKEIEDNFRETIEEFAKAGEEDDLIPENDGETAEIDDIIAAPPTPRTEETEITVAEEVCNDFRELRQKREPLTKTEAKATPREEGEENMQSPPYCLRYYRAKEGDTLEAIAERFSVSLAKMRGINELDEVGSIQGRMVRIQ